MSRNVRFFITYLLGMMGGALIEWGVESADILWLTIVWGSSLAAIAALSTYSILTAARRG